MEAKQLIIDKIIKDGRSLAQSFIEEARQKADTEIYKARTYAQDYQKKAYQKIEKEKQAIVYRKVSHAQIEAKKMLLAKKQQMIEQIFKQVSDEIIKDKKQYKDFLIKLIEKYAEDGDTVKVSTDSGTITETEVKKLSQQKGIKLSYEKQNKPYNGIILSSEYYDKNLTLKQLLEQIKEKHITKITKILFDGEGV